MRKGAKIKRKFTKLMWKKFKKYDIMVVLRMERLPERSIQ